MFYIFMMFAQRLIKLVVKFVIGAFYSFSDKKYHLIAF